MSHVKSPLGESASPLEVEDWFSLLDTWLFRTLRIMENPRQIEDQ